LSAEATNESERIELAKAYIALSNAHKLEFVVPVFSVDAIYRSPNVGVFDGRDAIRTMMTGFFTRYSDTYWDARNFHRTKDRNVQFDFELTATEVETGEKIQRTGVEELEFTSEGLIFRLEVRKR
jgi:NADH:ubiquinone oxidoreductase subunit D